MNLNTIKAIIWIMLGCGFTLMMTSEIRSVGIVGQVLFAIALLWRLLLLLRDQEPNLQRIEAATAGSTGVLGIDSIPRGPAISEAPETPSSIYRATGRSPIERLLDDEGHILSTDEHR